ncbi:MAG: 2-hydroxyacyl-CoA dehydratase [Clostridia bacterium]|nr:2-hydroxyacyl-CoA dehydratase [Clostridia bacterium]
MDREEQVEKFGQLIQKAVLEDPVKARKILINACRIQQAGSVLPSSKVSPGHRYASRQITATMVDALSSPEKSAMVSIFIPSEPLNVAGITPFSVEALSGFLGGVHAEQVFLDAAEEDGASKTLCSFHRIFHGAMGSGVVPNPKMLIYTNLACDANMTSFPYLINRFKIPSFFVEVPYERSEDAVQHVAGQLREMVTFISDVSGKKITDNMLQEAMQRSHRTSEYYLEHLKYQADHAMKSDIASELYAVFTGHIMMGTKKAETYARRMLSDIKKAKGNDAIRLVWLHMIPFLQPSANKYLSFTDRARIVACDLVYDSMMHIDPTNPYEAMAHRMVYSCYNGDYKLRAQRAQQVAEQTKADGIVVFAHWGCKGTLGASALFKRDFEEAGYPTLILDGDGGDPANCSDGQMATRFGAYLEMLEDRR